MRSPLGFTLLELIVTMAVAAIVLTVGVPGFYELINNNRLTSGANEFVAALNLARSEAVKRSVRVTVCKSADGRCCAGSGGYEQGWIVFADLSGDALRDPATCGNPSTPNDPEPLIRAYGALSGGLTLTGNTNVVNFVSFIPVGVSQLIDGGFQAGTLTLCKRGYASSARRLVLGRGGRVRVQRAEPASAAGC